MDWLQLFQTVIVTVVVPFIGSKLVAWASKNGKLAMAQRITHIAGEVVATILLNNPTLTPLQIVQQALLQLERLFPDIPRDVLERAASNAVKVQAV